ncbi:MAG: 1-deoxy-D-xylulose-5-phosphate synthase [Lentisphaeria bacterium]|nr:1-deoxy-D-xylulose-5-phosphate synthase [Lentisphaeria bacterium]
MPELLDELRSTAIEKLPDFTEKIRNIIIDSVSRNGGHLASSCGCVELITALHRVFNTPDDKIFFDVGHQAYAHKLITGRNFERLRRADGICGFPHPAESPFDPAVSGHAGTALSTALGHCAADPEAKERIIAVIGDGAMGCGITLEALNHAATSPGCRRLLIILNDNRMSISGNVGTLSKMLNRVIAARSYNRFRRGVKKLLSPLPRVKNFFSRLNEAGKSVLLPPALFFETLNIRYFGAINGNDLEQLLPTLERLKELDGPILLHVITQKGYGCRYAAEDPTRYHGIAGCDPDTGEMSASPQGFSAAFGRAMIKLAGKYPDLTAITPAMTEGTGLTEFAKLYPERCIDAGIAEEHALTFAAGLAAAGKLPVCAFYDTFLQRALDNIYHDTILAGLPMVIAVDRSGAVTDGPTHHGIYNCSFLRSLPDLTIITLSDTGEMFAALEFALQKHAPVIVRYPKGSGSQLDFQPFEYGKAVIRRKGDDSSPVLWACGGEVKTAMLVADILQNNALDCTVVDARFLKPFDRDLAIKFSGNRQFTIEDHCLTGGLYSALTETLAGIAHAPVAGFGWPDDRIIPHGETAVIKENAGLDARSIAGKIAELVKKN